MSYKGTPTPAPQTLDGSGKPRYTDASALVQDWWATHPRPVEKAIVPTPLVEILATEKGTLEFKGEDGTKIQATTPLAPEVTNETAPSSDDVPQV